MSALLRSHLTVLLCGTALIMITSLYLVFAVRPIYTPADSDYRAPNSQQASSDATDRFGPSSASDSTTAAGQWSTLAMLCLGLPLAVGLAFSATNSRRALTPAERTTWLLISLLSLAIFFLTAQATQTFFDQLLG